MSTDSFWLNGKLAVVTGGASGIGRAIAQTFAARGAAVHILDLNGEPAEATAREIVDAVPLIQVDGAKLEVGVGIATGEAFVGNIESVDRVIWGALGNTTNLAARLQAMSRELKASIVVDGLTRARSQGVHQGFEDRGELPVRGRSDPEQIYALPIQQEGTQPIPIPPGVAD